MSIRKRLFMAAKPRARRIAGEQVSEVDDARQRSIRDDDIRGMKVAVDPHRRYRDGGRSLIATHAALWRKTAAPKMATALHSRHSPYAERGSSISISDG
jgi:hypothetical protein